MRIDWLIYILAVGMFCATVAANKSDGMDACQVKHSYDTCFQQLNR